MKNVFKGILPIISLWPTVYGFLFGIDVMKAVFENGQTNYVALATHIGSLLFMFLLFGIYIYLVFQNEEIEEKWKVGWVFAILLLSPMSMFYYWYRYIW